jgi:hypothetical protein
MGRNTYEIECFPHCNCRGNCFNLINQKKGIMAISKGHQDGAMDFEELARAVFKCRRAEDHWGYANADNAHYLHESSETGKVMMNTIIDIAIRDNQNNSDLVQELLVFKNKVIRSSKKDNLFDLVEPLIDLLNKNGY